jgi:hypothetical protein
LDATKLGLRQRHGITLSHQPVACIAARWRPTGPWRRVLDGGKTQPPGRPGGFRKLKQDRILSECLTAVVRKPLWIRRPGKFFENRAAVVP